MDNLKLVHQLFVGKVVDEIGMDKTIELLKQAKEAFSIHDVIGSKLTESEKKEIEERIKKQFIGINY
tara:strand:+ start:2339 stop:2539 length:201 start_codon:yes stop_codon:yes gene_type:complete